MWTNFLKTPLYKNEDMTIFAIGWPCLYKTGMTCTDSKPYAIVRADLFDRFKKQEPAMVLAFKKVSEIESNPYKSIAINILVGAVLLFVVAILHKRYLARGMRRPKNLSSN